MPREHVSEGSGPIPEAIERCLDEDKFGPAAVLEAVGAVREVFARIDSTLEQLERVYAESYKVAAYPRFARCWLA
jgi:hypothetical protein